MIRDARELSLRDALIQEAQHYTKVWNSQEALSMLRTQYYGIREAIRPDTSTGFELKKLGVNRWQLKAVPAFKLRLGTIVPGTTGPNSLVGKPDTSMPRIHSQGYPKNNKMQCAEVNCNSLYPIKDQKRLRRSYSIIGTTEDPNIFLAQKGDKYGFLDQNGKVMIPFKYAYATGFSNGVAYVAMDADMEDLFLINTKDERVEEGNEVFIED
ncbi:hypothetical protein FQR65_LT17233 [Abscondita terminalis]|nr:hypothetical protein FQR65_LT17233 [Abscondita terminalis]